MNFTSASAIIIVGAIIIPLCQRVIVRSWPAGQAGRQANRPTDWLRGHSHGSGRGQASPRLASPRMTSGDTVYWGAKARRLEQELAVSESAHWARPAHVRARARAHSRGPRRGANSSPDAFKRRRTSERAGERRQAAFLNSCREHLYLGRPSPLEPQAPVALARSDVTAATTTTTSRSSGGGGGNLCARPWTRGPKRRRAMQISFQEALPGGRVGPHLFQLSRG